MRRRTLVSLVATALLAAAAVVVLHPFSTRSALHADRWPELPGLRSSLVQALLRELPESPLSSASGSLRRTLNGAGAKAGPALLSAWLDRWGKPRSIMEWSGPGSDESFLPGAMWLSRHPDAKLDRIMLEVLDERGIAFGARERVVAALCRPGNTAALSSLVSRVLDPAESPNLKRAILVRLVRLGVELPDRLDEALLLPDHDIDFLAASALARCGRRDAPSLVVEGLRRVNGSMEDSEADLLVMAALAISGDAPPVRALARSFLDRFAEVTPFGSENEKKEREELCRAISRELQAWLNAHPQALDTEFERARREYLTSERFRRETALKDYRAIAAAKERDLDFGAAALAVGWLDDGERRLWLERLDLLSRLVASEIRGIHEPKRILAVLSRRLLARTDGPFEAGPEVGPPSFLWEVLDEGQGNCLGLTSLYLAVGERLGLPLHAVMAPHHVFVRWDDGKTRINVETTEHGKSYPDEHYLHLPGLELSRRNATRGSYLVDLTKREALGVVYANMSCLYGTGRRWKDAAVAGWKSLECAEHAVALFPGAAMTWFDLGLARLRVAPSRVSAAEKAIDRAEEISPSLAQAARLVEARIRLATHHPVEALALADRAITLAPDEAAAHVVRARCLIALGRFDEAIAEADAHGLGMLGVQARILGRKPGWRSALEKLGAPKEAPTAWMNAVDALLLGNTFHSPEPKPAKELLDRLSWLRQTSPGREASDQAVLVPSHSIAITQAVRKRYRELVARVNGLLGR